MTTSYNGWSASPKSSDFGGLDNSEIAGAPGVHCAPGVRAGDVATVLLDFAAKFHAHVEALQPYPHCSGYNYRVDTNDPKVLSCHASATAIDLNSDKHPNGKRGTFTAEQVTTLRALLAGYSGVIHWGGDFVGTDDEMHFEIYGTAAQVAAVAARIRGAAPAPLPPPPADGSIKWAGHDATGHGESFRAELGDEGPEVKQLQHELNREFPAYSHLAEDGQYGHATEAVVAEFDHRAGLDPALAAQRSALEGADGENVGPAGAHAAAHYGLKL